MIKDVFDEGHQWKECRMVMNRVYVGETCGLSSMRGVAPLNTGKDTNAHCDAVLCILMIGRCEPVNFHSCIAVLHTCQSRNNFEV
jgi:hypothetical protein